MDMIYIWIVVLPVTSVLCVDYRELQGMGIACSPRDTCRRSSTTKFSDTNCACGSSCLAYNDCCVDGPKPTRRSPKRIQGLSCIPFLPNEGVYGISRCSTSWNGPADVKRKCEHHNDVTDPLMAVPVTQAGKAITYRNSYCAMCNSASTSDLTFWNLKTVCNSLSEEQSGYKNITERFVLENIVRVGDSWGVYHWNKKAGDTSFFPCDFEFVLPQSVTNGIRYCRPNLVSSCAPNWNRESVRTDCDSYMGVLYINGKGYRNAHCALCNHVSIQQVDCIPPREGAISTNRLSWAVLLDINKKDNKCSTNQVYDHFFKKCRRLICRSGLVPRDGQCVEN